DGGSIFCPQTLEKPWVPSLFPAHPVRREWRILVMHPSPVKRNLRKLNGLCGAVTKTTSGRWLWPVATRPRSIGRNIRKHRVLYAFPPLERTFMLCREHETTLDHSGLGAGQLPYQYAVLC